MLPLRSQKITGTFDKIDEEDWFALNVTQPGTLRILASTDTTRIDIALTIKKMQEEGFVINRGGEGEQEYIYAMPVTPGQYYFMVKNVIASPAYPVAGEYTIDIQFKPHDAKK